jgi:hypothetical protein
LLLPNALVRVVSRDPGKQPAAEKALGAQSANCHRKMLDRISTTAH